MGHENKVRATLERRAQAAELSDRITRILIPTEQEIRTRAGKKQTITRKVFPGYLLVEMILDDDTWTLIRTTPGVASFISSGDRPIPMHDYEVEEILKSIEDSKVKPRVAWKRGDNVRVVDGHFADFTGKIEEVNGDRETVKVLISIFGRDTPVELEFQQIERLT